MQRWHKTERLPAGRPSSSLRTVPATFERRLRTALMLAFAAAAGLPAHRLRDSVRQPPGRGQGPGPRIQGRPREAGGPVGHVRPAAPAVQFAAASMWCQKCCSPVIVRPTAGGVPASCCSLWHV